MAELKKKLWLENKANSQIVNLFDSEDDISGASIMLMLNNQPTYIRLGDITNEDITDGRIEINDKVYAIKKPQGKIYLAIPKQSGTLYYRGKTLLSKWDGLDIEHTIIVGTLYGKDVGKYKAIFTPKSNCYWADGTNIPKEIEWEISRPSLTPPVQREPLYYDGTEQYPSFMNYDPELMNLSGDIKGKNRGTYTAIFSLKSLSNTQWNDNTTTNKLVRWTIE